MPIPLGILAVAGAGGAAAGAYELISTTLVSTNTGSVTFSSITQSYKHLEVRYTSRSTNFNQTMSLRINGITSGYYSHELYGEDGSVTSAAYSSGYPALVVGVTVPDNNETNNFAAGVVSVLDYSATTKNKTYRTLSGAAASSKKKIALTSGSTFTLPAITSLEFFVNGCNLVAGSRFSLYGIVG
jgi:hypothetical protein